MAKWTDYPTKTTPVDTDDLMIYDATAKANKRVLFSGLWNWIVDKLTNAVISNLQTNNKTILGALNELNSNRLTGSIKPGETKEITFDKNYGCLFFFYHPYFGVGLYGICAFNAENTVSTTTILKQAKIRFLFLRVTVQ